LKSASMGGRWELWEMKMKPVPSPLTPLALYNKPLIIQEDEP
jgi:hypothetical protein